MKILHTSDWHIGHTLYNFPREEEFRHTAERIAGIVARHKPDCFLLSGDVFDSSSPSNSARKFFTDAMLRIHEAHPQMVIVVTAGNHDSASGHEVFRNAWTVSNVITVGRPPRDASCLDDFIVSIGDKGYVIAMPYANPGFHRCSYSELTDYAGGLNSCSLPVVLMAHTAVRGCDSEGHSCLDSEAGEIIGNIPAVGLGELGSGYDYCALGHIHRRQTLGVRARYCGTPLPISFDEGKVHSVTIVEIPAHGSAPEITEEPIEPLLPLVTLPEKPVGWEEALGLLEAYQPGRQVYLRLNVAQAEALPSDAMHRARTCAHSNVLLCTIKYTPVREAAAASQEPRSLSASEFSSVTPLEIARMFYADKGLTFGDEETAMFRSALDRLEQTKRNN